MDKKIIALPNLTDLEANLTEEELEDVSGGCTYTCSNTCGYTSCGSTNAQIQEEQIA